jgi:hypothetical protein
MFHPSPSPPTSCFCASTILALVLATSYVYEHRVCDHGVCVTCVGMMGSSGGELGGLMEDLGVLLMEKVDLGRTGQAAT